MQFYPTRMDKDPLPSTKPDPEKLGESPTSEEVLDHGVEETLPASGAVSVGHEFATARRREKKQRR